MLRRGMTVAGWGAAGLVAGGLIVGAFAVAGAQLTEPATPIRVSTSPLVAEHTPAADPARPSTQSPKPTATRSPEDRVTGSTPTAAPMSPDDHGGNSGPGGGGSGSGEPGDD